MAARSRAWSGGGKSRESRQGPADRAHRAHRVHEGERVGGAGRRARRVVHQPPHGEVGEQQAVHLLAHELGRLAAQHDACAPQVRLQRVESASNAVSISQRS